LLAAFGVSTDRAGSFSVSGRGTDVHGDSYKILAMGRCTLPFFRHGIRLRLFRRGLRSSGRPFGRCGRNSALTTASCITL
jgi:hypothetical protein